MSLFTPRRRRAALAAAAALTSLGMLSACASTSGGSDGGKDGAETVNLVGFSVLEAANKPVLDAWAKTDAGKDVTVSTSYGASGDQSRAVEGGLKADLVHLSLEPDVTRLVDSGQVDKNWKDTPTKGIATSSVVSFVVRPGNPDNIQGWDDLIKPGVEIITPNPASSGSAKWNILAAWTHITGNGGSEAEAQAFIKKLLANTVALPASARDATTAFTEGNGDVLLSYENEAITARENGVDIDYVVPDDTLKIENPAAVLTKASPKAKDLLSYLTTPETQAVYAQFGFRPVVEGVTLPEVTGANDPKNPFPTPTHLFTIDGDLGGWGEANGKFFDENDGIITKLIAATGKGE